MPASSSACRAAPSIANRDCPGPARGDRPIVRAQTAAWTFRARADAGPTDTVRVRSTQYES